MSHPASFPTPQVLSEGPFYSHPRKFFLSRWFFPFFWGRAVELAVLYIFFFPSPPPLPFSLFYSFLTFCSPPPSPFEIPVFPFAETRFYLPINFSPCLNPCLIFFFHGGFSLGRFFLAFAAPQKYATIFFVFPLFLLRVYNLLTPPFHFRGPELYWSLFHGNSFFSSNFGWLFFPLLPLVPVW